MEQGAWWVKKFPPLDDGAIRQFAAVIGDSNPIHRDNEAAVAAGLNGIIAPGVMTMGFVSATIAERMPGAIFCSVEMDLLAPLYSGATPSVFLEVEQRRSKFAKVTVAVKDGNTEVAKGSMMLRLPEAKQSTIAA